MDHKPELLAPAGNIESFLAAVENGADALYLGLKKFSARATASNFTLEELATLIPFAHGRGIRVHVALNSLIASSEIPELLDTLYALSALKPDALIVQDAALFYLVRRHFPGLRLHASTLAAAHNSAGVNALERMGARRVVLARELGLPEIERVCAGTKAEIEIFVHGALCYSYSGLCLTSSFRGGRSGLRGECVQPCRLKFRQGKKEGFFLSCNDLCALPLLPVLKRLRLAAFKIEGRMKPAPYIGLVVRAYRMVLDAAPGREEETALKAARELLAQAPSRHLTSGYVGEGPASEILSPHRSGSSGIWTGTVKSVRGDRVLVELRHAMEKGDRLRPESGGGKEQEAFTASSIFDERGNPVLRAEAGTRALLVCPGGVSSGDRLFKVGMKSESPTGIWKKIRAEVRSPLRFKARFPARDQVIDEFRPTGEPVPRDRENLLVKVGSPDDVVKGLQSSAAFVLLAGGRGNLERLAKQRFSAAQMRKIGIALPALLSEDKDIPYYRAAVSWFVGKGFRTWEVNNWGHFDFFPDVKGLRLIAGSRLNLRNEAALAQARELGCALSALSLEVTEDELRVLGQGRFGAKTVITLYSWPPLFTSRLVPDLAEDKPFFTPRNDAYQLKKQAGNVFIYADRPVSLFEELAFLRTQGFRNFLIDVSEGPGKRPNALENALGGFSAARPLTPSSRFNFDRRL
ncbi:MAG: peptidase U32 family protein [Syntrophobacteraceae bacterium]